MRPNSSPHVWHAATNSSAMATATPNARAASPKTTNARCWWRAASACNKESGSAPAGWLSPWISESRVTPDLLAETGYRYTLNWCHDDQPLPMLVRGGQTFWSVPYPQELNDIPAIVARQMDAKDFAQMIIDNLDEMLEQSRTMPLVMGIALHPYIVGQPYRLRHLRRALQAVAAAREAGRAWMTTPGAICAHAMQEAAA